MPGSLSPAFGSARSTTKQAQPAEASVFEKSFRCADADAIRLLGRYIWLCEIRVEELAGVAGYWFAEQLEASSLEHGQDLVAIVLRPGRMLGTSWQLEVDIFREPPYQTPAYVKRRFAREGPSATPS